MVMELHEYTDKNLPRIVFRETIARHNRVWSLTATLTRFGGLCVLVMVEQPANDDSGICYQGDNICEARKWLDDYAEYAGA
jgi:hypothetical protein